MSQHRHPHVSEEHEGKPAFEWAVAGVVLASTVCALAGHIMAATLIIALTAIAIGLLRICLKKRSPWKVRSVGFDSFISIALGVGLILVYLSIRLISGV